MIDFYSYKDSDIHGNIGPRTASQLSFSDNVSNSMVKELTQNSLDARQDLTNGQLKIVIRKLDIDKSEIRNFNNLEDLISNMSDYWNNKGSQYDRFFKYCQQSISGDKVSVLTFEDFNTEGLTGDDESGSFQSCVNEENTSNKASDQSLGNHGIGKNSVFEYSGIQTVFYSSMDTDQNVRFKGVTKLGTYYDNQGTKRKERIFYGTVVNDEVKLVSDSDLIPKVFRRSEPGLSQYVLCVKLDDTWRKSIIKAFLENYWFLLVGDKLQVEIDGVLLNSDNFKELAKELYEDDRSIDNPLPFIEAYENAQVTKSRKITHIGDVHIHIREADEEDIYPNKLLFLRDGMKIKRMNPGVGGLVKRIAGIMYCANPLGNEILGAMEPHRHDNFFPANIEKKQISDLTLYESDGRQILEEIERFKMEVIREIKNNYSEEVASIDIVDELFSNILGEGKSKGGGDSADTEEESFKTRNNQLEYKIRLSSQRKPSIIDTLNAVGNMEGDGEGYGTGTGGKGVYKGGNKGGKRMYSGGGGIPDGEGKESNRKKRIKSRFFISESSESGNTYKLVLRAPEAYEDFAITIGQEGDSAGSIMSSALLAVNSRNEKVGFRPILNTKGDISGYSIHSLQIDSEVPKILQLTFQERSKSAFKITEVS